jgi:aquaporin NIP
LKSNRTSTKWAVARIIFGQGQIVGATISLYCVLTTGVSVLTISLVVATGMVTLGSRILFQSRERTMSELNMRKLASEFLGTFGLVFAGTGAIVINNVSNGVITHAGIALTFGLIVLAMIYTFGDVSGAHLNPAVTVGFATARRFPWREVPGYVVAQISGAFAASGLLRLLFPSDMKLGTTLPAGAETQSFILEAVLTFLLMLVILNVSTGAKEKGITAGIAVGSVIALEAMFAGPICGASMNPARSLAPALVSGHVEHLWIYLIAPPLGACAAILACRCVREKECCTKVQPETAL